MPNRSKQTRLLTGLAMATAALVSSPLTASAAGPIGARRRAGGALRRRQNPGRGLGRRDLVPPGPPPGAGIPRRFPGRGVPGRAFPGRGVPGRGGIPGRFPGGGVPGRRPPGRGLPGRDLRRQGPPLGDPFIGPAPEDLL